MAAGHKAGSVGNATGSEFLTYFPIMAAIMFLLQNLVGGMTNGFI